MLCENCRENLATAFSSVFVDELQQELYLCQKCLNKKQLSSKIEKEMKDELDEKFCVCGISFNEISESGFVRCKECYNTFEKEFEPVILALHTKASHKGKRKLSKLEILLEKLEKAKENNFVSLALKIEKEIASLKGESNEWFWWYCLFK